MIRKTGVILAQLAALSMICQAGYLCTSLLHLSVPGNLVGMLLLLGLLMGGIVKLEWFESAASLLLTHLAFFFIPIAVGLMNFGTLLQHQGLALLLTLVIAAGAGIVCAGFVTQLLAKKAGRAILNS